MAHQIPCPWQSTDGYRCNFPAGHIGWHERHLPPAGWVQRARENRLPAQVTLYGTTPKDR